MLEALLRCDACAHGAADHAAGGCEILRCRCDETKDRIVERAVLADRESYRRRWQGDAP